MPIIGSRYDCRTGKTEVYTLSPEEEAARMAEFAAIEAEQKAIKAASVEARLEALAEKVEKLTELITRKGA